MRAADYNPSFLPGWRTHARGNAWMPVGHQRYCSAILFARADPNGLNPGRNGNAPVPACRHVLQSGMVGLVRYHPVRLEPADMERSSPDRPRASFRHRFRYSAVELLDPLDAAAFAAKRGPCLLKPSWRLVALFRLGIQ